MAQLTPDGALEILEQLHRRLDRHFRSLHEARVALDVMTPVYALEHGLSAVELDALRASVRRAVEEGFGSRHRQWWLPFVVYASESGYDYEGDEYWFTFERATPGWRDFGDRDRLRVWFRKFCADYGGAEPRGAFALNFTIIAWPITHAVLPVYLQRSLAQLLYEFRMGLTTELLHSPEALGAALASRAHGYTERFRVFCENTSLLGQVAAALLSGQGEDSPYLLDSTLARLVEGLERERQAKYWLGAARQAASRVRAIGVQPSAGRGGSHSGRERLPSSTDPRLLLRRSDDGWRAYAGLPDLSTLNTRLPDVYEELRSKRARIEGADGSVLARGRLAASGQEVRLTRWPNPARPFIELENGSEQVNAMIAEHAAITRGPIWLFKRSTLGLAVEVKGRLVHPGSTYYVVHDSAWTAPGVTWIDPVRLDVQGVLATKLTVPATVSDAEVEQLVAVGISVASDVAIRPVGLVASAWDGDGAVEWLAGETGLLGISAQHEPVGCSVSVDGERYSIPWPPGEAELFLALEELSVGTHELHVGLIGEGARALAEGSLIVTIREPQVRAEGGEPGEGIRLMASPARPTMGELWEPGTITIDGTIGVTVDLNLSLYSEKRAELARIHQPLKLPMLEADWAGVAKRVQSDQKFGRYFDQAESIELTVSKAGVGFASLTVDRGFQPLRWQLIRGHDGEHFAQLIDRTDSGQTTVELFTVESPLVATICDANDDIVVPATGGLLRGTSGSVSTTLLLPTRPNELRGQAQTSPSISTGSRTVHEAMKLIDGYQRWALSDLPGDVFAQRQREIVLDAITQTLVSIIAGGRWAALERDIAKAADPLDYLDAMQKAIGDSDLQKELAKKIANNLFAWLEPAELLRGFAEEAESAIRSSGITGRPSTARFLLTLAGRPGLVMDWERGERSFLLQQALESPVLVRAARFAVVGTRELNEVEKAQKGF